MPTMTSHTGPGRPQATTACTTHALRAHTAEEHMKHVHNVKTLLAGVLMQFILTLFSPSPRSHSQAYVHLLLASTEVPALSQVPTPPRASVQLGFQGTCVRLT